MSLFVSSIIGNVNEQNIIAKNVRLDDWTPELAIIASNGHKITIVFIFKFCNSLN